MKEQVTTSTVRQVSKNSISKKYFPIFASKNKANCFSAALQNVSLGGGKKKLGHSFNNVFKFWIMHALYSEKCTMLNVLPLFETPKDS